MRPAPAANIAWLTAATCSAGTNVTSFTAEWHDGAAHFVFAGDPERLLRDPSLYRHRYRVP